MNPNKAIYYKLVNDSTVNGIVSGQVYQFGEVPQGIDLPYVMIQKVSDVPYSTKDSNSLFNARIQVNCYGTNHNSNNDLSVAVMNALDRSSTGDVNGIYVVQIDFLNEVNLNEYFAEFEGVNHIAQDYAVVYLRGDS